MNERDGFIRFLIRNPEVTVALVVGFVLLAAIIAVDVSSVVR